MRQFQDTKKFWGKEDGRQYFHFVHSFHKDENITEEQAAKITAELCEAAYPGFQAVVVPHHDKPDRIDVHVVGNSVSYMNGKKVHTTKKDIDKHKKICNDICRKYGFSVPEKGKNFYGKDLDPDTVISWKKDTYQTLKKEKLSKATKNSDIDMVKLVLALLDALLHARSLSDFIERMKRSMWNVAWSDKRKHITFESVETGRKFRATNLDKTYGAKFRFVFGQDFVLDKQHMEELLKVPEMDRERYYDAAYQELIKNVSVWVPDIDNKDKSRKTKTWQTKDSPKVWTPKKWNEPDR